MIWFLQSVKILFGFRVGQDIIWFQSRSRYYLVSESVEILFGSRVGQDMIWFQSRPQQGIHHFELVRILVYIYSRVDYCNRDPAGMYYSAKSKLRFRHIRLYFKFVVINLLEFKLY